MSRRNTPARDWQAEIYQKHSQWIARHHEAPPARSVGGLDNKDGKLFPSASLNPARSSPGMSGFPCAGGGLNIRPPWPW